MTYNSTIDLLHTSLYLKRFENELEYLISINTKDNNRVTQLKEIIQDHKNNNIENKKEPTYMSIIEQNLYKQPWNKLKPFHRVVKIKEYVESAYEGCSFQKKLLNDLNILITDNKLSTDKSVKYDTVTQKIVSIPAIKFNKDNVTYTIK
jgi:hypothetical protein